MRELSFIISNLIEILNSQNASKDEIQNSTSEVIEIYHEQKPTASNCKYCDTITLKSFPVSYCIKCGKIYPY